VSSSAPANPVAGRWLAGCGLLHVASQCHCFPSRSATPPARGRRARVAMESMATTKSQVHSNSDHRKGREYIYKICCKSEIRTKFTFCITCQNSIFSSSEALTYSCHKISIKQDNSDLSIKVGYCRSIAVVLSYCVSGTDIELGKHITCRTVSSDCNLDHFACTEFTAIFHILLSQFLTDPQMISEQGTLHVAKY
jgi:hypothetical protein